MKAQLMTSKMINANLEVGLVFACKNGAGFNGRMQITDFTNNGERVTIHFTGQIIGNRFSQWYESCEAIKVAYAFERGDYYVFDFEGCGYPPTPVESINYKYLNEVKKLKYLLPDDVCDIQVTVTHPHSHIKVLMQIDEVSVLCISVDRWNIATSEQYPDEPCIPVLMREATEGGVTTSVVDILTYDQLLKYMCRITENGFSSVHAQSAFDSIEIMYKKTLCGK